MQQSQPPEPVSDPSLTVVLRGWWARKRVRRASIPSVEQQVHSIMAEDEKALRKLALFPLLALMFLSSVLTFVAGATDLNAAVPWLGIGITAISSVLALAQGLDWLLPNVFTHRYRLFAERQASKALGAIRRRKLRQLLALYGREKLAQQLLPASEAHHYTVAHERARARRRRNSLGILVITVTAAVVVVMWPRHVDRWYWLEDQVPLDRTFKVAVLAGPVCGQDDPLYQGRICVISVKIFNDSLDAAGLGLGSFGDVTSQGPRYCRDYDCYQEYATAARWSGNYYELHDMKPYASLQPKSDTATTFSYRVGADVVVDEVVFTVASQPNVMIHIHLGKQ